MLNLLADWILSALALLAVAHIVPGFEVSGFGAALVAAIAVGLANATLGLLLKILTLPLTIFTLGIFWFVINAFMLKIAAAVVPGFTIQGFLPAFLGAVVLSLINILKRLIMKGLSDDRDAHQA
jgi:putative membrane protein